MTRSLVEGLTAIGASFNYNPRSPAGLSENVLVLAGVETLRQAIAFKRRGLIRTLSAGPNVVVFASDYGSLLCAAEIDRVIAPCDWVIALYTSDCSGLQGKCLAWPAGVDTRYWRPGAVAQRNRILLFEKQSKGPVGPVEPYVTYLKQRGHKVSLIRYGSFTHAQYLRELQQAVLLVGFVADESQGLAWAEAWSADVPTLLWRNTKTRNRGRSYACSTAPYLERENGMFFDDFEDFKHKSSYCLSNPQSFSPRLWTVKYMSDEVCARNLYTQLVAA